MIDTKAEPLLASQIAGFSIPVAARTALLFRTLAVVAATLAALLPLAVVFYWLIIERDDVLRQMGFAPEILPAFDPLLRFAAILITVLTVAPLAWGVFRLQVCFRQFAQGRPFAARGIAGLRDFAAGMGLAVIAKPIGFTLLVLLLSWNAPAGMRQLAISIDSDTLIMALFAATVASLAWAMEKAAAIAEENSQFV
jgi:hypothetical protein